MTKLKGLRKKIDQQWAKRAFIVMLSDIFVVCFSYFFALLIRFELNFSWIDERYLNGYVKLAPIYVALVIIVYYIFGLYHSIWRFVSVDEMIRIVTANIVVFMLQIIGIIVLDIDMPKSFYLIGIVLNFLFSSATRYSYRFIRQLKFYLLTSDRRGKSENIMVIGAGEAGRTIIRELTATSKFKVNVACIIDDNPSKRGRLLEGVNIVGNRYDIPAAVKKYKVNKIIYAIPASNGAEKKEILNICSQTDCELQIVPGIYQIVNGDVKVSNLRKIQIHDLLGRDPVQINLNEIRNNIKGKVVMVTGGGGSIGSELCRQIAKSDPKQLIIFDIYENNAYSIQLELKNAHPELDLLTLIGSVRNTSRLESVIDKYRPDIVFHAAAHKHVPLMEDSPNEAVKNNVFGTYKAAQASAKFGVKRFILISTDKAVNPTSVMGASKRICEMIVQMMNRSTSTEFVAVRFGNVLGSNGSVVPIFEKQIAKGGPVTVTHPEIIRYFMTIPEAVSLVLEAACYAKGGEIFVLDMGEPVKISDMARNMIRLSGYEPDVDIKIVYTGLRPGEKLYEELLMKEEGMQETQNKLIYIGKPIDMDDKNFQEQLKLLEAACKNESSDVKNVIAAIVPTYSVNSNLN